MERWRLQEATLGVSIARIVSAFLLTLTLLAHPSMARPEERALPAPRGPVVLTITGAISRTTSDGEALFDETMLEALPPARLNTGTVVTDGVKHFEGVLMRDLFNHVGAEGRTVTATALNDYVIDIPMTDFRDFDVIMATHMDGERLLASDKGPLWIVYPRDDHRELQDIRYDYRWVWQLVRLDVK
ncbi:molybdopterin-dependent oxidoreductase [Roseovarius sp. SK2]|uniref:molybdopterin-dependent oxidoreductase n=1 Tax=Roseovarius sp. SK2 TaxID=3028381 RepID=UPI00237C4FE0|nr:molybdopterin-dependent oxidoreductase [Roseovarius sp. SK2]MDD9727564.1 molybdopterin-dependent oxidoreductase [Roseovarius sp. SK2]